MISFPGVTASFRAVLQHGRFLFFARRQEGVWDASIEKKKAGATQTVSHTAEPSPSLSVALDRARKDYIQRVEESAGIGPGGELTLALYRVTAQMLAEEVAHECAPLFGEINHTKNER